MSSENKSKMRIQTICFLLVMTLTFSLVGATDVDNNLTILNTPPTVASASLSPIPAYTNNTLICSNGATHDDNNEAVSLFYTWFKNNVPISNAVISSLTKGNFTKNDNLICGLTPYDGTDNGTSINSSTLTISNMIPIITPAIGNINKDADGTTWTLLANATDLDVDDGVDTLTWYVNNSLLSIDSFGNLSDTPTESEAGDYPIRVNITDATAWDEENLTYAISDVTPPRVQFATGMETNNSLLKSDYIFMNLSYTEPNFKNMTYTLFDADGLAQTYTTTTSTETSHNFTSLISGYYKFNITMWDEWNNSNTTETNWLTLDTTPPTITSPVNATITYPASLSVDFDASDTIAGVDTSTWTVNDSLFTINTTGGLTNNTVLPAGSYLLNLTIDDTLGNQNYTMYLVTVNQNAELLYTLFNSSNPIAYPNNFKVYSNATTSFTIYRNGTSTDNNSQQNLSAGTYNFTVIRTDQSNYSNVYDEQTFVVNQGTLTGSLASTKGFTYTYDNLATTISLSESNTGDSDVTYTIYRDAVSIGTGETVNLPATTYSYILNSTGGTNWSSNSAIDSQTLTINKATPIASITNDTILSREYDGTNNTLGISESNVVDDDVTYVLWRNNTNVGSSDSIGFGYYQYKINTTGGVNWSATDNLDNENLNIVDTTNPLIDFNASTEVNNSQLIQSNILIGVDVTELRFKNITYGIYDVDGLVTSYSTASQTFLHNFSSVADGDYYYNVSIYDQSNNYNITETRYITLDTEAPQLAIQKPDSPSIQTYGSGTNLPLNFTSVENNPDSCWFSISGNIHGSQISNNTISGCTNSTFDLNLSDYYTLTLWANDTLGQINSTTSNFLLSVGSPVVTLSKPENASYINTNTTQFNFTATDYDGIKNCSLYNNATGSWAINETLFFVVSGSQNTLSENLSEGDYLYNVECTDNLGLSNFSISNYTYIVDTTEPNVSIFNDNMTNSSSLSLTIRYDINDTYIDSCYFTLRDSSETVYNYGENTSIDCNGLNKSLSVFSAGTYTFRLWGEDLAGNINTSIITFTTAESVTGGGGGGGGYSESTVPVLIFTQTNLSKFYSYVERGQVYAKFFLYCESNYNNKQCNLQQSELDTICSDVKKIVNTNDKECNIFYQKYLDDDTENVDVNKVTADELKLIQIIKGYRELFELSPLRIDSIWLRNSKNPREILVNSNRNLFGCKPLTTDKDYSFSCELLGKTEGRVTILQESNYPLFKTYNGVVGWTDKDGITTYQNINLRLVNLLYSSTLTFGLPIKYGFWIDLIFIIIVLSVIGINRYRIKVNFQKLRQSVKIKKDS